MLYLVHNNSLLDHMDQTQPLLLPMLTHIDYFDLQPFVQRDRLIVVESLVSVEQRVMTTTTRMIMMMRNLQMLLMRVKRAMHRGMKKREVVHLLFLMALVANLMMMMMKQKMKI